MILMTHNVGLGLPLGWKADLIGWVKCNGSVRELWLLGSRAKGIATADSEVELGLALMSAKRRRDRAFENYVSLHAVWRAELETVVQCHVSLVPMVPSNQGDEIIRSTGICLWESTRRAAA